MRARAELRLEIAPGRAYSPPQVLVTLFLASLLATVVALVWTLRSGFARKRSRHYVAAVSTLLLLGLAIFLAERVGGDYRFDEVRLEVHLACAFAALGCIPFVAGTGIGLAMGKLPRKLHRGFVYLFVLATLAAIGTAVFMFLSAEPIAD